MAITTIGGITVEELNQSGPWTISNEGDATVTRKLKCGWSDRIELMKHLVGSIDGDEPHGNEKGDLPSHLLFYRCVGAECIGGGTPGDSSSGAIDYTYAYVTATYRRQASWRPDIECDFEAGEEVIILPAGMSETGGQRLQHTSLLLPVQTYRWRRWVPFAWFSDWQRLHADKKGKVNSAAVVISWPANATETLAIETLLFTGYSIRNMQKHGIHGYDMSMTFKWKGAATPLGTWTWNMTIKPNAGSSALAAASVKFYNTADLAIGATGKNQFGAFMALSDAQLMKNYSE